MIRFYEKQCLETPIKKNHGQALVDCMDSLGAKHNALLCSTLKTFPGAKENLQVRSSQLDLWLKSGSKESFVLELFTPKGREKLCVVVELNNIKILHTDFGKRHRRDSVAYIETSAFSESPVSKRRIAMFYRDLQESMKESLALKKSPPMSSIWWINKTFNSLRKKAKRTEEPTGVALTALDMLKDRNFRDTILRARQAKDPTISNIAKSVGLNPSAIRPIVSKATKKGIIIKEYDIVCTSCAKVLARVPNKEAILRMANDNASCPSCGTAIGQTSCEETFTIPPKVGCLLNGNKWLCLYARRILRSLELSPKQILVEVVDGPNELDLVANFDGDFVLMELKGNKFSIGHAYSFVGKCSQYKPNISIVISTEKIGPDVKEYIKNTGITPQYVEDINKLDNELKSIFSKLYGARLGELIQRIPWNSFLSHSLLNRFGLSKKFADKRSSFFYPRMFRHVPSFE